MVGMGGYRNQDMLGRVPGRIMRQALARLAILLSDENSKVVMAFRISRNDH